MISTREEFKRLLIEDAEKEFASVPKTDHVFSERFERRMERLFRRQRSPIWRLMRSARIRVAVIAAAVVLLMTTACAVPEVRAPIVGFAIRLHSGFAELLLPKEERPEPRLFVFDPLPEGFTVVEELGEGTERRTVLNNAEGTEIILDQAALYGLHATVDTQHGVSKEVMIGERIVLEVFAERDTFAIWTEEGYYLQIVYRKPISEERLEELVTTVVSVPAPEE